MAASVADLNSLSPEVYFSLFFDADIVIGLAGTALDGALFMPPGRTVVEVIPFELRGEARERMLRRLGLKYFRVFSRRLRLTACNPAVHDCTGGDGVTIAAGVMESVMKDVLGSMRRSQSALRVC